MLTNKFKDRMIQYALLMRLHRPIGIMLLSWPTLWSLWIASEGNPQPLVATVFILGIIVMRSAGCIINDFADRKFDPHVERTRNRPIATGKVSSAEALLLFALLCVMAFGLVLMLNTLTILLSFVGVLLAASYPFMKRFTYLPQVHLGIAFGWAAPMAFAAQTNTIPSLAWLLTTAIVLWVVAHDTIYAMVDRPDDIRIGIKSTAILFGNADQIMITSIQAAVILVFIIIGEKLGLGMYYYLGLATAAALGLYQQRLIRTRQPQQYFRAFLNNNWFGAAIFMGIWLHYCCGLNQ
uniref:4-hydroxybenzoate octaprenyltransferase n=1 Tax=Candidatus Kentrum sp. TUN TaxID=2126343 RepID=A0A450ZZX1_9GAMM|nr:MAG: 4-hydroxybenzoate polyprenyltransferase [Candidatus Kentron sp. TUN]VFK63124.1 MAG: 4-hydroxybenzoate polyprenyltransferase [Candidatus Kentron sp. TUN]VFK67905.1 MAG: 4-hydroxybenzoate polyprenyltransferase [Candidatus Kentron sp. TUN]